MVRVHTLRATTIWYRVDQAHRMGKPADHKAPHALTAWTPHRFCPWARLLLPRSISVFLNPINAINGLSNAKKLWRNSLNCLFCQPLVKNPKILNLHWYNNRQKQKKFTSEKLDIWHKWSTWLKKHINYIPNCFNIRTLAIKPYGQVHCIVCLLVVPHLIFVLAEAVFRPIEVYAINSIPLSFVFIEGLHHILNPP